MRLNLKDKLQAVKDKHKIEVKNPLEAPYADPDKTTDTQRKAIRLYERRFPKRTHIAVIGGKGAGKSHLGVSLSLLQAQEFPGSIGCVISNSHEQTNRIISQHIFDQADALGLKIEYFGKKKIRGRKYNSVFVIDLDGQGIQEGSNSYILLHSFEAVAKLEGAELDWGYVEEIQDAEKKHFVKFTSRIRGTRGNNSLFIMGMPDEENHWMYTLLPKMGFDEDRFGKYDEEESMGVLFEPAVYENLKNLPDDYIDQIRKSHDEATARKYINGERVSLNSNKVCHQFDERVHKHSWMSKMMTIYDPTLDLILSYDFNVSPMCVSVYQLKRWHDKWEENPRLSPAYIKRQLEEQRPEYHKELLNHEPPSEENPQYEPNRWILAQIDEFEVWQGGTSQATKDICHAYRDHTRNVVAFGDSTGKSRDTRGYETDWDIISRLLRETFDERQITVIRGLDQNVKSNGEVKYNNPPKKDQINVANAVLRDGMRRAHACFLPESDIDSGGLAASVAMVKRKPDGRIDDSIDRSNDRSMHKTHFMDTFLYAAYWFTDGDILRSEVTETRDGRLHKQMRKHRESSQRRVQKKTYTRKKFSGRSSRGRSSFRIT
jgi:hypothetical protein